MIAFAPLLFLIFYTVETVCQCPKSSEEKLSLCQTDRTKMLTHCPNFYCGTGEKCNDASKANVLGYDPHDECRAHKSETTSGYCYPSISYSRGVVEYKCHAIEDGWVPSKYVNGKCIIEDGTHGLCGKKPCPAGKFGSKTWATEPRDEVWYPKECEVCPDDSYSHTGASHSCQCPPHGTEAYAPDPDTPHLKTAYRNCPKGTFNDRMYTNLDGNQLTDWRPRGVIGLKFFKGTPCGKCERCPLHSFSDGEASNVHCNCPFKGHRANVDGTGMEQCPRGYYQDTAVQWTRDVTCPTCRPCSDWEQGSYAGEPGQATCICPKAGYEANRDGNAAQPCRPGTFKKVKGCAFCKVCPEGLYQSHRGAHECAIPSGGHYALNGTIEQPCTVGTFKSGKGPASICDKCEAGKFQRFRGSQACSRVTVGHEPYSKSALAIRLGLYDEQRPCKPGYHQDQEGSMDPSNFPPTRLHTQLFPFSCRNPSHHVWPDECAHVYKHTYIQTDTLSYIHTYLHPHTIQPHAGQSKCKRCEPGKFSIGHSQSICDCASSGHIPNKNKDGEKACPKGTYTDNMKRARNCNSSSTGHYECTLCAAGKYAEHTVREVEDPHDGKAGLVCGVSAVDCGAVTVLLPQWLAGNLLRRERTCPCVHA